MNNPELPTESVENSVCNRVGNRPSPRDRGPEVKMMKNYSKNKTHYFQSVINSTVKINKLPDDIDIKLKHAQKLCKTSAVLTRISAGLSP